MTVLVTGSTGFVGKALVDQFRLLGIVPCIVSRSRSAAISGSVIATPAKGELFTTELIARVTKVVNLAGEDITGHRWNSKVRGQILSSRIEITRSIVASIRRNQEQGLPYPQVLVNASAVGYYGTHPTQIFTEENKQGNNFLADVCQRWESEAFQAQLLGVRVICLRFGQILESDGGMLPRIARPFHFGVGGYLGDGQQWLSWIHRKELIHIILQSLEQTDWQGVYNLTSPHAVTMKEFMEVLGQVLGSKSRVRIPALLAKLLWGEMAQELLLKGQKAVPMRLVAQGYKFRYPHLTEALQDIYRK
jgi:uncharacterized protein (TIGR01777 family)